MAIASAGAMMGDRDVSMEAMRRQTKETPDDPRAWHMLAFGLLQYQQREEAVPVLQKWFELAPNDRDAATNLSANLLGLKRYPEAISTMEKAVERNPDTDFIQFALGNAYIQGGDPEKAFAAYSKAISLTLDPPAYENDAAYYLAGKKVHMDEAEKWAKDAVSMREKETREVRDLSELDVKHLRLIVQLASYWDTLGYIYYQRGDYQKAEPFLRCAFDLNQYSAISEHLGDVYDKLQQPKKAIRFYSLAANSQNPSSEVQDKLFRLRKAGVPEPPDWRPREELSRMRTVKLPQITKKSVSAEFMILLSNQTEASALSLKSREPSDSTHTGMKISPEARAGELVNASGEPAKAKVLDVKFLSGAEELRGAERLLRDKNLLTEFPDDVPARIFRRGILMCSPYTTGCQFTLLTADSVHSAN